MRLVRQPINSNQCGQACVAMVCGITLDAAVAAVGTTGRTRTKQLIAVLRLHGVKCGGRLKLGLPQSTAICKVTDDIDAHWVVRHKGIFYDPATGCSVLPKHWRITSHLEIK